MNSRFEAGALNILLVPFILMTLFFLSAAGFTYWAYNSRADFKANADTVAANAVQASRAQISAQREKDFAAKEAYPFNTYSSPASTGSIVIKYPKTWSAYVKEQAGSANPIDGYFYPNFVPFIQDSNNSYALRLRVLGQSIDNAILQFQPYVQQGSVVQQTYRSPNIPNVIGYRLDGRIATDKQGIMIILPIRDKTLELWTESNQFKPDYLNTILPNFTFTP